MLKTKLNKPSSSSKLIYRKELIDKLEDVNEKKLTLVSAPAGYGKSTLIAQWIDQLDLTYSWYSLDKSDNDIFTFLNYTVAGIQTGIPDFGSEAMRLLKSNTNPTWETIATYLVNDFCEINKRFTLVFDDYHLIENKEINDLIYFLIGNLPAHIQVVLITRSDPTIPLTRLRSQQMIIDIRLSDLCFNTQDIYVFFKKNLNFELSKEDAKNLEDKTEGWIAGLQLTALSLQGKENVSDSVEKLKGNNRHIMDYLIEEVLQQQDTDSRNFLLYTSILNQFNASLCNQLLNIHNSQEIIERFERNNMFIIPLDNERNWFRYHHLFASLLQHRLTIEYKNRIPELHANASQWFENDDQLVFALEHSLAAGDKPKALNHFASIIHHLWQNSQFQTILRFGEMFTHEEIIKNAGLSFNYFWNLFQSGYMEKAENLMNLLKSQITDKAEIAMASVCINNLKVSLGDIESAYSYSEMEIQNITENADYWNILAFLSLGEVHLLRFEFRKSFESYDQAALKASAPHHIYFEMINRVRSSFVLWLMGEYSLGHKGTKELLDKFNAAAEKYGVAIEFLSSMLNCVVGNFLINTNQIEEGLKKSIHGYDLSKKTTNPLLIASCTYLLAEAYYLAGEYNKAISLIEELDTIPYKQASKFLCVLTDSLKSKLYLLTNNQDKIKQLIKEDIITDRNHAFESTFYKIEKSRYFLNLGEISESIDSLKMISQTLNQEQAFGLLTEVELLMAKAYYILQDHHKALEYLTNAIHRTQSAGLIRIYFNEGEEMEALLKEIKTAKRNPSNKQFNAIDIKYVNTILRVFDKEKSRLAVLQDDSLSIRELDTLKLIAENLSNQEIADELYISITTVKTHVRNILLKLEVKNRNEAVLKAKDIGILPS